MNGLQEIIEIVILQQENKYSDFIMRNPIYFFSKSDRYFWLSNFSSYGFEEDGVFWPTVEHYFQTQKFHDRDFQEKIRNAKSPKQAKALGQTRKIRIRNDWEAVKEDVMLNALRKKFQSPKLRQMLLSTGKRELIENSTYDKYWGCGRGGRGKNRLGKLLM